MRILVTGANGYIGAGVVKKLLDRGHEVVATDLNLDKVDNRALKIEADIFKIEDPYIFFKKPEILLHLAWKDGFIHNSESHIYCLDEHFSFLNNVFKSDIKRIAIMGTMHEIGRYNGRVQDDTPCNPINLYGISKNALRQTSFFLSKKYSKEFQWLRGFYLIGNATAGNSVFSKLYFSATNKEEYFDLNSGKNKYDFLPYEIFVDQVAKAIEQDKIFGIINICSGKPVSLKKKIEDFIRENNLCIKIRYGFFPDRPYDSKKIWGDNKKITKIMNTDI